MKDRVTKFVEGSNLIIFQNQNVNGYERMVKRRLEKEGKDPQTFKLSPRRWGVRIKGTPIVTHYDKWYLEVIFLRCGKVTYFLDGEEIDKGDIEGLDEDRVEGEQGGLEDKVIIRTYTSHTIKKIVVNGEEYVEDDLEYDLKL